MSPSIEEQIEGLKRAIAETEAQRASLGDEFVDSALKPYQRKLKELTDLLSVRDESPPEEPTQQRKLVTLLFMDIVGSTSIAQHMDPEDVGEVFDVALKKLAKPIQEHGGHVTRFMGDGFLSVFGAPQAREDDPEQAVRAGLKIIELAGEVAAELEKPREIEGFQVRVGVNTGLVLLGGETEAEDTLMGAAVNLAARLESAAPPGGLLVSHDTYRHIRGVFDVEPWKPLKVKGFDEPVQVYRVLRARERAFRQYTRGVEGVETRMVGRETEFKYLQDALMSAIEEKFGQIVTITGEAGVGKSRLLYEFQNWIELLPPPAVGFFQGRGRQEAQGLPYGLLRNVFEFYFQIQDEDSATVVREKVESNFGEIFGTQPDGELRAHILGQWLGFDFSSSPYLKGVLGDAEQLRNRGLMYLGEYFRGISGQVPVVIFLEDIHWADDSSLDALNWLEERLNRQRLLVVCAARPTLFERRPHWGEGLGYHRRINLEPLSRRESLQLVAEILKLVDRIPPELRELVVEGAEGNPFYVEELVKMLVEDEVIVKGEESWYIEGKRLSKIEVPPTLVGVLQARLDSLPVEERTVLQQASVVGRLFWDRIVAYIQSAVNGDAEAVPQALNALRSRELVYRREESTFADAHEYLFKHDILREVTYESVLKRRRREYHGLVGDWLIAHSAYRAGEYSGLIAEHLMQAGRPEEANQHFLQAGESALGSFANAEAERYFSRALELTPTDVQKATCLAGLGEILGRRGLREEAVQNLREGIELYLEMGEGDKAAELYAGISRILWYEDYRKAWNACQEGLERLKTVSEGPGMARLLSEAAMAAFFCAQPTEEVSTLCYRAIEIAEGQGELEAWASASNTIALVMDDINECIKLMQEVAAFSEVNGLWYQANRARSNLAALYFQNFRNLESAHQLSLQVVEKDIQIGNIEWLFFELQNLVDYQVRLGHLRDVEEKLLEILHRSAATQSRIEEFLNEQLFRLYSPKGRWRQALEFYRQCQEELQQGGNVQLIVYNNLSLAKACLELNRFKGVEDLSEAEAALQENNDLGWDMWVLGKQGRLLMAILASRRANFSESRRRITEAVNSQDLSEYRRHNVYRLEAEAELAHAEGHWEEAISACQELIDIYRRGEYRWEWARQLIDLGDALLGRGGPGDREQAEEAYRQALEMFTEMGAPGYVKVLEERLGGM